MTVNAYNVTDYGETKRTYIISFPIDELRAKLINRFNKIKKATDEIYFYNKNAKNYITRNFLATICCLAGLDGSDLGGETCSISQPVGHHKKYIDIFLGDSGITKISPYLKKFGITIVVSRNSSSESESDDDTED